MRPSSPPAPARTVPVTLVSFTAPIAHDPWFDVADDAPVPDGDVIVAPARLAQIPADRPGRLGVRLGSDARPEDIAPSLVRLALVVVSFPKFRDGRGFTIARLLRQRFGFRGEIRAVGDVLRDQLGLMWRTGFSSAALRDADPIAAIQAARSTHLDHYQSSADATSPIWTRRRAAATR